MAEPVWYYARGDVERGPFTLPQIKALANASRLRPDDLVWKEGMENWMAAKEIPELFPAARLVGDALPTNGSDSSLELKSAMVAAPPGPTVDGDLRVVLQRVARILAVAGVLVVVGTRGCESLSERRVERLAAVAALQVEEDPAAGQAEKRDAERALLEHQAAAFLRGVSLYMGILVLLAGAAGLMTLPGRAERWLGVGMILIVVLAVLTNK